MPATSRSPLRPGLGNDRKAARARMLAEGISVRFVAPMVGHLARVAGHSTMGDGKGCASANVAMGRGLPSGTMTRGCGILPDRRAYRARLSAQRAAAPSLTT